jgi:DNA-binding response OmpR family regulator
MKKRILSISYEPSLLSTRRLLLEQMGYEVISAEGFTEACEARGVNDARFDLVILGHSVSPKDKEKMIAHIKRFCGAPILALLRPNEAPVAGATQSVGTPPEMFMDVVRAMLTPE